MLPHRVRNILLATLAIVVLSLAALALWLDRHPEHVLALVNRELPQGVVLRELRAPRVSLTGGQASLLRARWDGNELELHGLEWGWRVESWWPLALAPQSLEIDELRVRLSPTGEAGIAALPRPWQNAWWPRVEAMDLRARKLVLRDHAGALLLEAELDLRQGASSGSARLEIPGRPVLALEWHPLAHGKWQIDGYTGAPYPATGSVVATATAAGLDWHMQLSAPEISLADRHLRDITLGIDGSSDLFEGRAPLVRASVQASGADADGRSSARCAAAVELARTLASTTTVTGCTGSAAGISFTLAAPVTAEFDTQFAPLAVTLGAGLLQAGDFPLGDWIATAPRITLSAGTLWAGAGTPWTVPPVAISAQVRNPGLQTGIDVDATLGSAAWRQDEWSAVLSAALRGDFRGQQLAPLDLRADLRGTPEEIGARGRLTQRGLGRVLQFDAGHLLAENRTSARLDLDTRGWNWGEGLLATLLGPRQELFDGDVLRGELRAELRVEMRPGSSRIRASGNARDVYAIVAGTGIAGLEAGPIGFELRDWSLHAFQPLALRAGSVNAGMELNALHARLEHTPEGWWLHDAGGKLLGGTFTAPLLGPLGADPLSTTVTLKGIELQRIAQLIDDPDLTLSGTVGGSIPLTVAAGAPSVSRGRVQSEGAGVIRYRPPLEGASAELDIARRALANLQFATLEADMDYAADGNLVLRTQLRGRNPDLDVKRPVHLNLTVETNLRTLLQGLRAGDRVNQWLETRAADGKR